MSILDLSAAGHQPMFNEDSSLVLVFNGEIYNYLELIPELQAAGHVFRSRSDSEVILHAYEEWGADCVKRFNGMWAFAIWDTRSRELFMSRDRFGVKPFNYLQRDGRFVFS
ncbi:asparagine synthetase B family protein, partial [Roseateles sp. GG27B]